MVERGRRALDSMTADCLQNIWVAQEVVRTWSLPYDLSEAVSQAEFSLEGDFLPYHLQV